jgi:hypothetical protein
MGMSIRDTIRSNGHQSHWELGSDAFHKVYMVQFTVNRATFGFEGWPGVFIEAIAEEIRDAQAL